MNSNQFVSTTLGNIAQITMGQSPKGSSLNKIGEGVPFIQGNRTFGFLYPTIDTYTSSPVKNANRGDILFSVRAPVGDINIAQEDLCIGRGICAIKSKTGENGFLFYLLKNNVKRLISQANGTVFTSVNRNDLESFEVTIPSSLDYRTRISNILSTIDRKIELNNQLNDYLEKLGQMIFDVYLDSCEKKEILGNILDFGNGFAFKSGTYDDCGIYKILTIKNVQNGIVDCSSSNRVNSYPAKMKKYCRLNIGDVVLSLTGNVGRIGIVAEHNCLLNQRVAVLQPKNKTFLPGLYFLFRKESFQDALIGIAKGTAQANLSPIETLRLTVPYDKKSFVTTCSKLNYIFDLILKNRIEEIALNKLRDLLLPKLISGEFNLSKNIDD